MINVTRRCAIGAMATVALMLAAPTAVVAQETLLELRLMAPAGAGGGWDTAARSLQQVMTQTGAVRSVQVTNVPGAGGTVGLSQFVNQADGSSNELLVGGITMVGAIISNNSPVTLEQVTPLARLTGDPLVIVVPASSDIQTIDDLAEAVRNNTASTIWAGGSAGGADHMLAALFTEEAGADPAQTNYVAFSGGGEALAAMLGGRVTAGVSGYGEFQGQIEAGELRALALSSPERLEGVDVPTLTEQGVDIELVNWRGLFAGPNIADEDKARLSEVVERTLASSEWQEILQVRGWSDYYSPADEFATFVSEEETRVREILTSIGLAN